MTVKTETRRVRAQVGMESCVGFLPAPFPMERGNYFSFACGLRCCNMWSENLREAAERFGLQDVEISVLSDGDREMGLVTDPRIPRDWRTRLCFTGAGHLTPELREAVEQAFDELARSPNA